MSVILKSAWTELVQPMLHRPKRVQVAALCYRRSEKGKKKKILLITSRDQGRWILPKGWPIDGLDGAGAALQEAFEEAGVVKGKVANKAIGTFDYVKRLDTGGNATCEAQVYPIEVKETTSEFPEAEEREQKWVSPKQAAEMVQEPQLQELLRNFG